MEANHFEEEARISKNILDYISKPDFMNRDICSLDRILEIYFDQKIRDPNEEKEVVNFLFNYIKEKGNDGCVLFRHIRNSSEVDNIVLRIYHQYGRSFNYDVMNPSLFLSSFSLIKKNETLKRLIYFLLVFIPLFLIFTIISYNRTNQVKNEFIKQLNDKEMQLNNQIQATEKLEKELKTITLKYENDLKIKEQLGTEITTLKEGLKDEMSKIKSHFESELTNVKEKQQEVGELVSCKENLANEQISKKKLEIDLSECNSSLHAEQINKEQLEIDLEICNSSLIAENESKKQLEEELGAFNISMKELEDKLKSRPNAVGKISFKVVFVFIIDVAVLAISILMFLDTLGDYVFGLVFSIISELALDFSLIFEYSYLGYVFFTIAFAISIFSLLFISHNLDLKSNKSMMFFFVHVLLSSAWKYMQFNQKEGHLILSIFVCIIFLAGISILYYFNYKSEEISNIVICEVSLFIYYIQIESSVKLISNIVFIIFLILVTLEFFDHREFHVFIFACSSYVIYFIFLWNPVKINMWGMFFIIVESILFFIFRDERIIFELFVTSLLFNYIIFDTIVAIAILYLTNQEIQKQDRSDKPMFLAVNAFIVILIYLFSLFKFWKS